MAFHRLGSPSLEGTSIDEIEGYALAEQWEELADRFLSSSAAAITVTLTAEEAQQVHDAITFGVGYLLSAIEPIGPQASSS